MPYYDRDTIQEIHGIEEFRAMTIKFKKNPSSVLYGSSRLTPGICTGDFNNKLVVITGATSGIGYHTARK